MSATSYGSTLTLENRLNDAGPRGESVLEEGPTRISPEAASHISRHAQLRVYEGNDTEVAILYDSESDQAAPITQQEPRQDDGVVLDIPYVREVNGEADLADMASELLENGREHSYWNGVTGRAGDQPFR